jgi:hypothetical protein
MVCCAHPAFTQNLTNSFQDGVGGYSGQVDVTISTEDAEFDGGNGTTFQDADMGGECAAWRLTEYETRALIRFDDLNLPGAKVLSAVVDLTFDNWNIGFAYTGSPPSVAEPATAAPNVVTGTTNLLSVLGADQFGEPTLSYTWSASAQPAGAPAPIFTPNGGNAAKNTGAAYGAAGPYALEVVISNPVGLTATSAVDVLALPVFSAIGVSPPAARVVTNLTQLFAATAQDQFGNLLVPQTNGFSWTVSGGGTIDSTGLFTAGSTPGGPFAVDAQLGALTGAASVTVTLPNQPLNLQYTAVLTDSGGASPLPVVSGAQPCPDSLAPALAVAVPNAQAPRLLNLVNPAIAIPFNSPIRMIEARWNGAPLALIDPEGMELVEEAHSYGSMIPFFKPLFSVAPIAPGTGTLQILGFDSTRSQLASVSISNLAVASPPVPLPAAAFAANPHPRVYLTASRLAAIRARPATGYALQRYNAAIDAFTNGLAQADVLSSAFADIVYDPEDYIPALALAGQLHQNDDTNLAQVAVGAARALAVRMANEYDHNIIPTNAAYDAGGLYTLTNFLAGPGYYYTHGSNDISLTCSADPTVPPLTQSSGFTPGAPLIFQGLPNQPVTADVRRNFGHDSGYDIRFGLRDLMLAYDWIYDSLTADERATFVRVAANWVNWYHTAPGYCESMPYDNYYAGYLQGIALTAVATAGDNPLADSVFGLLRTKLANEVPILNQRAAGGDWPEGWNYGPCTVLEFSLVNTLLKDAGEDWSADFDWLQSLPRSLLYMTAPDFSQTRSYGGYSGNYPDRTSPSMLAVLASTTVDGAFASLIYNSMNANPNNDFADESSDTFYEMIFAANSPPTNLAVVPLSYFNSGTGRFFSRSSLTEPAAYFVSTENISYVHDHYGYADGDVRLYHGTNCLVCPSAYRGPDFEGEALTPAFSTYEVNGASQSSNSRNNANPFVIEAGTYAALAMRFESAWAPGGYDEDIINPDNPLDYIIREAVHLRPGALVVRDLHRRRHPTDTLAAQFHIGLTNAVESLGNGYQIGPLLVSTFYPQGVTVSFTNDTDGGGNLIGTLMQLGFASSTAPMELLTVFSETLAATNYANGLLLLQDGTQVRFAGDGSLSVATSLNCRRLGNTLVLSWSNPAFVLQAAPAAGGPFATIPGATSPFTNSITGACRFFRLLVL